MLTFEKKSSSQKEAAILSVIRSINLKCGKFKQTGLISATYPAVKNPVYSSFPVTSVHVPHHIMCQFNHLQ